MNKSFWIPLLASIGVMVLLYIIGIIADIDILQFKFTLSYTEITFLPIIAGFLICERFIKYKSRKVEY